MVLVEFLGPIAQDSKKFDVKNLKELKNELLKIPDFNKWIELCAISLNDEVITDINTTFKDGDKIALLPPVCGG